MTEKILCPVCGQHSFDEDNDFEECPVCGWVNDGVQRADPISFFIFSAVASPINRLKFFLIYICDKLWLNKNITTQVPFACETNIPHLRRPEGYSPIAQVFFIEY